MVSAIKGLLESTPTRGKSNYEGATRGKSGRVFGKDPSLKSAWRGASAIRGVVPKWVTAPPKEGRGHAFKEPSAPKVDRRREVTARLSYVPRGAEYAGKVAGNARYLGRKQAVDRGEADEGHERYLAREGPFFTASSDGVKAGQVAEACRNDPRQFRLIVAPEDGERMTAAEMKAFIREYMARVEHTVGARLAWAAVIHKADNAARESSRHAHVIIRGRDLDGNVLRFAKPFVKDGFRTIARELATEKLGPLNDRELERQRQQRKRHKDRNREWKRMEREGATMAERRAFAREGRSKGREPDHSPSRFHEDVMGQGPPHCPWRRSW
jgi:hypothetical protein